MRIKSVMIGQITIEEPKFYKKKNEVCTTLHFISYGYLKGNFQVTK